MAARQALLAFALLLVAPLGAFQLPGSATCALRSNAPASRRVVAPPACQVPDFEDAVADAQPPGGPLCDFPGCDSNGRVQGGLGAMKFFEWWPIKVCTLPLQCLVFLFC